MAHTKMYSTSPLPYKLTGIRDVDNYVDRHFWGILWAVLGIGLNVTTWNSGNWIESILGLPNIVANMLVGNNLLLSIPIAILIGGYVGNMIFASERKFDFLQEGLKL
jgi:hypothetical protein